MNMLIKLAVGLVALIITITSVAGAKKTKVDLLFEEYGGFTSKATFYDQEFLNGQSTAVEIPLGSEPACKNLPRRWRARAKSVDTYGTCISGCSEADCGGECVMLYPSHGEQQLKTVEFDKKIVSAKRCF